jgi:Carboxypeptidase regulatory-like domain
MRSFRETSMTFRGSRKRSHRGEVRRARHRFRAGFLAVLAIGLVASIRTPAQAIQTEEVQSGRVAGTVTDARGDAVVGATAVLTGAESASSRTVTTDENGFFEFDNVESAVSFEIVVRADGFAEWTSPAISLQPGEMKLLGSIPLRIATLNTTVTVTYDPVTVATEQIKVEETQRVLGIIPNFYISYEGDNAAPLTTKMKFQLALKVSYDPITVGGVALMAGLRQATDSPNYQQGAKGYGERFGAISADGFSDILIGGAILPSLLHEDPRYFYKGTGATKSRLWHAVSSPFICKRDDGTWGPNYSSLGGDLASSAIANLYYPDSNRGPGLVFSSFAIGTGERIAASVAQEFLLSKFTHRGGHTTDASKQ